ncbi:MAG TPA: hypothetical protein ACFYEF_07060, partial [Candidatus Wunengus sp. YC63]|uniref:hypothetical protein n=1 Tax=unclassified Candidatus Wunengus TaxID=3367695 RepID=UPI0040259A76
THPPLTPPIKGGEYLVAEGLIKILILNAVTNYLKRRNTTHEQKGIIRSFSSNIVLYIGTGTLIL